MSVDQLHSLSGAIITPGHAEWDSARLFHSGIGEPDVIVRAETVEDVRAAVRYAAAHQLPVVIRGGGHSTWGSVPGGVVVDLAALADVDVSGAVVRVGGGATWGQVAAETYPHGLAISSGDSLSVGVGGLTLGGGIGLMVRAWGLTVDQLVGAQLVTAAGDVVEVTAATHPDLFWALRGGGGNFGVVTRFDFVAHELPGVVFAELSIDGDRRQALRTIVDLMRNAPRDLTVSFMEMPPMDPHAPPGAMVTACWVGSDINAAREALAPVLAVDNVTEVSFGVRDYPGVLMDPPAFDPEHPMPGFVGGNSLFSDVDDVTIDQLVGFREAQAQSVIVLRSLGGAYGDVGPDDTPFAARGATWFAMAGAFDGPHIDVSERARIEAAWAQIEERGIGFYGNFTTSVDPTIVSKMYPEATMSRLARVKATWDPGNVFSRNHNIIPAG